MLLRANLVVPKRRRAHLGLERLYLTLFLFDVKDTSTGTRRAS
jgi:hypothetical protein